MLTMTKKSEYALIAACHLARHAGKVVSARDIASAYTLRLPLLMNVLKVLNQQGVLRSVRGAHGGYALVGTPDKLSLARLIEAVDGPMKLVRCVSNGPLSFPHCELTCTCPVRSPLQRVHDSLQRFLGRVTIAEIALERTFDADAASQQIGVMAQ